MNAATAVLSFVIQCPADVTTASFSAYVTVEPKKTIMLQTAHWEDTPSELYWMMMMTSTLMILSTVQLG